MDLYMANFAFWVCVRTGTCIGNFCKNCFIVLGRSILCEFSKTKFVQSGQYLTNLHLSKVAQLVKCESRLERGHFRRRWPVNFKIFEKLMFCLQNFKTSKNERQIYPHLISLSPGDQGALFDTQPSYLKPFCNKNYFLG